MRRQFGRDDGPVGMDLAARMGSDQADDSFDLRGIDTNIGIDAHFAQYVDTQRAVRVDHHLDDARIGPGRFERRYHRLAQHRSADPGRTGGGMSAHWTPPASAPPSVRVPHALWPLVWAVGRAA